MDVAMNEQQRAAPKGQTDSDKDVLLSIRNLETRFGTRVIHHGLDLDVYKGEILVLFGGSGTGKSTLLRAIIGLDRAAGGSIKLEGEEIS
ncbi:MAG: ATP-binding cassette domain-containing protein, partial [Proteobacteria bacterium]